jgi:acyl-CoA synthetase (AMP-forming)/AMP-acid ligase II/NAD(P)-dependent dehydrogenase (short-subunit alcohol dehydrogenase family)
LAVAQLTAHVLGAADAYGDKVAVVDAPTGTAVTYRELLARIAQTRAALLNDGIRPGSVLAVRMPNGPDLPVVHHAIMSLGCTVLSLNALATDAEADAAVSATGAVSLVSRRPPAEASAPAATGQDPDQPAVIFLSSGTTGTPKPIPISHRGLIGAIDRLQAAHPIGHQDVVFAAVPLAHVYGMQSALHPALRAGATLVVMERFDIDTMIDAIAARGVTSAYLVPAIIRRLLRHPRRDEVSGLATVVSAGAPLDEALASECAQVLGVRVVSNYGLTEAGGCTHTTPVSLDGHLGAIGRPLPGIHCQLADPDTGALAPPGEPGELRLRLPGGDWLQTGDLVRQDKDGFYYIVGRLKEVFKCNGNQIAPAELEAVLLRHPALTDAAVIGVPDSEYGEIPKAFVVPDGQVTTEDLTAFVTSQVAAYKRPRAFEFVSALPRNAGGKLMRRRLAERRDAPVTIVTGGSRGLGRVIAETLLTRGHPVAIIARDPARLSKTEDELRCYGDIFGVPADLTAPGAFRAALNHIEADFGSVGTLVNNAGVQGPVGELWLTDPDEWWATIAANLRTAALASADVLPVMIARGGGRIINIASHAGATRWPHVSAYSVSKAALIKLTENLAMETRRYGIPVISFHPGMLEIGLGEAQLASDPEPESWSAKVSEWLLERKAAGEMTEISDAVAALAYLIESDVTRFSGRYLTTEDVLPLLTDGPPAGGAVLA